MAMRYTISETDRQWAARVWDKLEVKLKAECRRVGPIMPYIPVNGTYEDMAEKNLVWWTNGFWAGILWQMYHATKEDLYKETAEQIGAKLDQGLADYTGLDHDLGFLWLHTAVADYRLTGNQQSRIRGLHAAGILAGRFQPAGEYIRAWNEGQEGVAIVDCLMNLPCSIGQRISATIPASSRLPSSMLTWRCSTYYGRMAPVTILCNLIRRPVSIWIIRAGKGMRAALPGPAASPGPSMAWRFPTAIR